MKLKIVVLMFSVLALANCGKNGQASGVLAAETPSAQDTTGSQGSSSNNYSAQVADSASDTTVLPVTPVATTPVSTGKTNIFSSIGSFFSGIFGGQSGSNPTGNAVACGVLPTILNLGSSFLTGGNVIVGGLVSNVANSLLKCGSSTSLVSLLPNGSSGSDQVFNILSQVLQLKDANKDFTSILTAVKNPQDIAGMINVLSTLTQKTGNSQLQDVLQIVTLVQAMNGQAGNHCGSMNSMECSVFNVINTVRNQNGLPALVAGEVCTKAAQLHADDMSANNFLSHLSSNGLDVKTRLNALGIQSPWAELIVRGTSLDAEGAVSAWMSAEGQKKNILSNLFTSIGVGYADGYFTTCFSK
jgi:uncharacterized protein YkwD